MYQVGVTPLTIMQQQPAKINLMEFIRWDVDITFTSYEHMNNNLLPSLKCLAVRVLREFCLSPSLQEVGHHCLHFYNLHS